MNHYHHLSTRERESILFMRGEGKGIRTIAAALGLSDIAKYIHTNTAYLSRVFKKEMGIGVSEYMNRLRMDQAARLLREINMKVADVAEKVGIEDARYFSSLFKRYTGTSPSLYRKNDI